MYDIFLSDTAEKQLSKLDKNIRDRIGKAIEKIRIRPGSFVERLVGMPFYKLRAGDYRIILDIQRKNLIILIIEIGHRKNIYKR